MPSAFSFRAFKKDVLAKADKSRKGSWDERVIPLCDCINKHPEYVSLSSCSGRIMLIERPRKGKKKDAQWLFVTHNLASSHAITHALREYTGKGPVTFVQESVILHVACSTMDAASRLLVLARLTGFRRCGIIAAHRKIVCELICMEHISAPVHEKMLLVNDSYLAHLVKDANRKLKVSWKCIDALRRAFSHRD